jgi:hypothetical protein
MFVCPAGLIAIRKAYQGKKMLKKSNSSPLKMAVIRIAKKENIFSIYKIRLTLRTNKFSRNRTIPPKIKTSIQDRGKK